MSKQLLIIDPQNDFCMPGGALFVDGAQEDMQRLAAYIANNCNSIDGISVSLDSHHLVDISHPLWWRDKNGNNPTPFTIISVEDVMNGKWSATVADEVNYSKEYVEKLAKNGKYPLCIWPPHCLIGTTGHNISSLVMDALKNWSSEKLTKVNFIFKGMEVHTESYSAFQPEVNWDSNPYKDNWSKAKLLFEADEVIVAGEASSHCVKSSVLDLIDNAVDKNFPTKLRLLTDCMSPVGSLPIFKEEADGFLKKIEELGGQLIKSTD